MYDDPTAGHALDAQAALEEAEEDRPLGSALDAVERAFDQLVRISLPELAAERESLLWEFVHIFHRQAARLDRSRRDARYAFEAMRDFAALCYTSDTGTPWRPPADEPPARPLPLLCGWHGGHDGGAMLCAVEDCERCRQIEAEEIAEFGEPLPF